MLLSSFFILHSLKGSSLPRLESWLPHAGKGHSMGRWMLPSVTANHFSSGLMNQFQFLKESEISTEPLSSATQMSFTGFQVNNFWTRIQF